MCLFPGFKETYMQDQIAYSFSIGNPPLGQFSIKGMDKLLEPCNHSPCPPLSYVNHVLKRYRSKGNLSISFRITYLAPRRPFQYSSANKANLTETENYHMKLLKVRNPEDDWDKGKENSMTSWHRNASRIIFVLLSAWTTFSTNSGASVDSRRLDLIKNMWRHCSEKPLEYVMGYRLLTGFFCVLLRFCCRYNTVAKEVVRITVGSNMLYGIVMKYIYRRHRNDKFDNSSVSQRQDNQFCR